MSKISAAKRLREIAGVLAHYGFGYIIDSKLKSSKSSPQNLRKAFEDLGPTFIKIGQILSTRPDILPSQYIEELQKLQDSTPYIDFEVVKLQFQEEFQRSITDDFKRFESCPAASASIAQAHRATLKTGQKVIVKIQRPGIEEQMELDIAILKKLLHLTRARFQDSLINPEEALDEILHSTRRELDFRYEAASISRFCELNKNIRFVGAPQVVWNISSRKILTMEYIEGYKITDTDSLVNAGYDLEDIGKKLALSYFKQIFEDGFFHGDPHPGNLIIREGRICYIDFGIMGDFSKSLKAILNDVILSIALKDIDKMIGALLSVGIKKGYINRNKLYEDIDYLYASYLSAPLENIKMSQMLEDIFEAAKRNNIRLPKDLTLLIRGLVIIEGVVAKISPDVKIIDVAIPYVKSTSKDRLIPGFNELIINSYTFTRDSMQLPTKLLRLIGSIIEGRVRVQLEHRNLLKPLSELNKMVNRIVFAIITSSLIIGSSMILNSNIGPKVYDISIIGITGYAAAAILGFWLIISILRSGKL